MISDSYIAAADAAAQALEALGQPFCLIGGMALPAWGRLRFTHDVDFLLLVAADRFPKVAGQVVQSLRERGFAHLERTDRKRLEDKLVLFFYYPIPDQGLSIRVDAILAAGPFHAKVLERKQKRRINDHEVWVAACEDLILLKMAAGRPIDVADAKALFSRNATTLDRGHLSTWAAQLGLDALWAEVSRGEADA